MKQIFSFLLLRRIVLPRERVNCDWETTCCLLFNYALPFTIVDLNRLLIKILEDKFIPLLRYINLEFDTFNNINLPYLNFSTSWILKPSQSATKDHTICRPTKFHSSAAKSEEKIWRENTTSLSTYSSLLSSYWCKLERDKVQQQTLKWESWTM